MRLYALVSYILFRVTQYSKCIRRAVTVKAPFKTVSKFVLGGGGVKERFPLE
jgi:hypothetical protein